MLSVLFLVCSLTRSLAQPLFNVNFDQTHVFSTTNNCVRLFALKWNAWPFYIERFRGAIVQVESAKNHNRYTHQTHRRKVCHDYYLFVIRHIYPLRTLHCTFIAWHKTSKLWTHSVYSLMEWEKKRRRPKTEHKHNKKKSWNIPTNSKW